MENEASTGGGGRSARRFSSGELAVEVHPDRAAMGAAAAAHVAGVIHSAAEANGLARVVFACAPSQDDFLAALTAPDGPGAALDWSLVEAFHMDDYVGLPGDHPESFRHYLRRHLLDKVGLKAFFPIAAEAPDTATICREYEERLAERPVDLVCLGIGENGHIAFNDPPVADFDDPRRAKEVVLDEACRQQQVNDGCFPDLGSVPTRAITLTIPVFREARALSCVVPGPRKAAAVKAALEGDITTACPASILRHHPRARLFLDADAAAQLSPEDDPQ